MQFVDYKEAEIHCSRLAQKLESQLGAEINSSRFIPIPRGGYVVLGMLGYLLHLTPEQFHLPAQGEDLPLVIVDDCAISGARFAATLEKVDARRVIFAHLLSHPKLRQAILEQEPRVIACLAAGDLIERADLTQPEKEARETDWHSRLTGKRYWLGVIKPFAFAWGEPDSVQWNQRTNRVETWQRVSPRRTLEARASLGVPFLGKAPGRLDIPRKVFWKIDNEEVLLWHAPSDVVYGLKGVASDMWRSLAAYGDLEQAASYLLDKYSVEETQLMADLQAFTADLLGKGLLTDNVEEPSDR